MNARIVFDEKRCTNCHLCSMFCSLNFAKDGIVEFRPSIARVRAVENSDDTQYVAHVCLQCDDPQCAAACPLEAITKDPSTGIVMIAEEECTGCEACIDACEFGCIFLVDHKAVKCEVCDDPLCVRACAVKALHLADPYEDCKTVQADLYREVPL